MFVKSVNVSFAVYQMFEIFFEAITTRILIRFQNSELR